MHFGTEKLHALLVDPGHIEEKVFAGLVQEAAHNKKDVLDLVVDEGFMSDEQVGRLVAGELGVQFKSLKDERIDLKLFRSIPELVARSRGVFVFGKEAEGVQVGMTNPSDVETRHMVEKRIGAPVVPYLITRRELYEALLHYNENFEQRFQHLLAQYENEKFSREERDDNAVQIVDELLRYAHESKASDIHIEPYADAVGVRFRIDGVLHDVLEIKKSLRDVILARIKILSKLRTDEHRAAQDGKFRFRVANEVVDVRVSIVPVTEGENIVLRVLSIQGRQYSLADLGISERDMVKVNQAIRDPHGMILITGPTGSGKTTTAYAVLKVLHKRTVHIATIEDPVEYDMEGVSQIQVNTKTNLTFAKGLRAIVRQDPDIILVGEIRDQETAGIAVNSAMTGHLVISTLHANDAATTLPRLLDMGIEPFLIASTVNVVVAQRLVRKMCAKCRISYTITDEERMVIESDPHLKKLLEAKSKKSISQIRLYKSAGCSVCANTGFNGRIGIFEVLEMSDTIKNLVIQRASNDGVLKEAKKEGMTTMLEDGIEKVYKGITTLQEVFRVTKE